MMAKATSHKVEKGASRLQHCIIVKLAV